MAAEHESKRTIDTSVSQVDPKAGKSELARRSTSAAIERTDIGGLLNEAIAKGATVDALEKLVGLHDRMVAKAAATEFASAFAGFQADCPPVLKTKKVDVTLRNGGRMRYNYAPLDVIANTIRPHLHARGMSYTWDSTVNGQMLVCTCRLRHVNGHEATATFSCPIESPYQAMSEQHKTAGALTFARRQSLVQVCGLTSTDDDIETGDADASQFASDSDVRALEDLLSRSGADHKKFLEYAKVTKLSEVRARDVERLRAALHSKMSKGDKEKK